MKRPATGKVGFEPTPSGFEDRCSSRLSFLPQARGPSAVCRKAHRRRAGCSAGRGRRSATARPVSSERPAVCLQTAGGRVCRMQTRLPRDLPLGGKAPKAEHPLLVIQGISKRSSPALRGPHNTFPGGPCGSRSRANWQAAPPFRGQIKKAHFGAPPPTNLLF